MRRMQRFVGAALAACLVFMLVHTPVVTGQKGTITCESYNNEYHHCYANTQGRVTLKQKLSTRDCVQGRSWGYDDTGVWVDRGCRAEFEYGREQGGGGHAGRNAAIAAGAIGGAIALALVISHKKDKQSYDKLSESDKAIYNKGWDRGQRDAADGDASDYKQYGSSVWENRESVFRQGYNEGYQHGQNKRSGSRN